MKAMTLIPSILLTISMVAAFTVVLVATLKILRSSYSRVTAAVLALGVTIMALVGTGPIIFGPSLKDGDGEILFPMGGTLMLLPFLALAIGRLLCDLLVAANGVPGDRRPPSKVVDKTSVTDEPLSTLKESKKNVPKGRPKGRPKKQAVKEDTTGHSAEPTETKQPLTQTVPTGAK